MKLGLDVRHEIGKTVSVMQNSLTFASASGLTSYQASWLELHDNGWSGRSLKGPMKTLTATFLGGLIAIAVHAETVYPIGVGSHNSAHVSPGEDSLTVDHQEMVNLFDADGLISAIISPYLNVYDTSTGSLLPITVPLLIWNGYGNVGYSTYDQNLTVCGTDEAGQSILLYANFRHDQGPDLSRLYLQEHPATVLQTWEYGFDVISYETVSIPEPPTLLLLAGGVSAIVLYRRKVKPSSA